MKTALVTFYSPKIFLSFFFAFFLWDYSSQAQGTHLTAITVKSGAPLAAITFPISAKDAETYTGFIIIANNVVASTNSGPCTAPNGATGGNVPLIQAGTGTGPTWQTTGYYSVATLTGQPSVSYSNLAGGAVDFSVPTAGIGVCDFKVEINNFSAAATSLEMFITGETYVSCQSPGYYGVTGAAFYNVPAAAGSSPVTALRVVLSNTGSTFAAGTFTLYGIK